MAKCQVGCARDIEGNGNATCSNGGECECVACHGVKKTTCPDCNGTRTTCHGRKEAFGQCTCVCHNSEVVQGADNEVPTPADPSKRFVPPYYQLEQLPADPDILDVCAASGFDAKAYLVVETVHKLLRFQKKGFALKDLNKSIEQLVRLRDIAQAEVDEANNEQRQRNRSQPKRHMPYAEHGGWNCGRETNRRCPSVVVCQNEGCQL